MTDGHEVEVAILPCTPAVTVRDVVPEPPEGWELQARCLGSDPSAFYADEGADDPAERTFYGELAWRYICPRCPVRADCLAASLLGGEEFGVWGGLPPPARRSLLRFLLDGLIGWESVTPSLALKA